MQTIDIVPVSEKCVRVGNERCNDGLVAVDRYDGSYSNYQSL